MSARPGQNSGQAPPGYSWGEYLDALIAVEGTLTAVAQKLLNSTTATFDITSIERALRRLRDKGQRDGGAWGARLLRTFGVPAPVEERVRWMAHYHSPFCDLPVPLCLDLLRVWDRPPLSGSRARVYLQLGFAICALRARQFDEATRHLGLAQSALGPSAAGYEGARLELLLARAYLQNQQAPSEVPALLDEAEALLGRIDLPAPERACFLARLVDQRAFLDNRTGDSASAERAWQRYLALPADHLHPFASYRRAAGLAYGHWARGEHEPALTHVQAAIEHAGDGGYVRLRTMGLLLEAKIRGPSGQAALQRARAIATQLDDDELLARVARAEAKVMNSAGGGP